MCYGKKKRKNDLKCQGKDGKISERMAEKNLERSRFQIKTWRNDAYLGDKRK